MCVYSSTFNLPKFYPYFLSSISAVPPFPGLRRFPDGRDFVQWTGDDSKALMKVTLSPFSFTAISVNHIHLTIYYAYRYTFVQLSDMSLQTWSNASRHSLISATLCAATLYLLRILTVLKMHLIDFITTETSSSKRGFALT